jgi:hypothetical protein
MMPTRISMMRPMPFWPSGRFFASTLAKRRSEPRRGIETPSPRLFDQDQTGRERLIVEAGPV